MTRMLPLLGLVVVTAARAQSAPATAPASPTSAVATPAANAVFVVQPKLVNMADSVAPTIVASAARAMQDQGLQVLTKDDTVELVAHAADLQLLGSDADQGSLAALGQAVGAPYLLATVVSALDDDVVVQTRLIETAKAAVLSRREVRASEHGGALLDAVVQAARLATAPVFGSMRGTLQLAISEEGANVLVDGEQLGVSPLPPTPISGGFHVLTVTRQGFIRHQETLQVASDQVIVRAVNLRPSPEYAKEWRSKYGLYRTIAWVGTGLVVPLALGGAGLGGYWIYRNQVEDPALQQSVQDQINNPQDPITEFDPRYQKLQQQLVDQENTSALIGSSGLVAGSLLLIAGGVGLYFWLFGEDPDRYAAFE